MRWTFDKIDRLEALIARLRQAADYLRRAACDVPAGPDRAALLARALIVEGRTRCLCTEARRARRLAVAAC